MFGDLRFATLTALSFLLSAQCLNTEPIMKAALCHICVQTLGQVFSKSMRKI